MKVSEAIEKLAMKRDDALKFQKLYNPSDVGWSANESKAIAFNIAINTLQKIDEPQAEKVEVPSCMGTFLDRYLDKKETAMHIIMHDFTESKYFDEFAELPLADYPMCWDKLMASALMFGYIVKPKRWVVKSKDHISLESFINGTVNPMWTTEEPLWMTFTDKSKAEAVATLIDGSVEEV